MDDLSTTPQYQVSAPTTYGDIDTSETGAWRTVSNDSGQIGILWASDSSPRAGILGDFTNPAVLQISQLLQTAFQSGYSPLTACDTITFALPDLTFGTPETGDLSEISDEPPAQPDDPYYFALYDDSTDPNSPEFLGLFMEDAESDLYARDAGGWIPVGMNRDFYDNDPITVDVTDKFVDLVDSLDTHSIDPTYDQAQRFASPDGDN